MIPAMYTALSGMSGFTKKIEVIANNIANVNTDGFKGSRTEFVEVPTGGILPVVEQDNANGPAVLKDSASGPAQVELSNVDLGEEAVSLILAQRGFQANLQTLKTADSMLGSVLDVTK
ncbi:MAG TPA: flagellar basal body rod C-terminal domain-containing protein [Nitrospira sp.]|nr:flagellar basal body rod C-terminal domain-containing protein [Nitrospira sp.]